MADFKPIKCTHAQMEAKAKSEGQLFFCTDTRRIYLDLNTTDRLEMVNKTQSIVKNMTIGQDWTDTGISAGALSEGTYIIQVNTGWNGTSQIYRETWVGIMYWYSGGTNSTVADEILLHSAGHAPNSNHIYLRTLRRANSTLMLQIAADIAVTTASDITFTFKKVI